MPEHFTGGLLGLHALTALHPGAGTALGTVDLPVQRERHTGWPNIAGSALKGILRDRMREGVVGKYKDDPVEDKDPKSRRDYANADDLVTEVFGPPTSSSSEFAGAVSVGDARLLAYPVRSLKGVFAWVSCPAVLERLERDIAIVNKSSNLSVPRPKDASEPQVSAVDDCPCWVDKQMVLEEFDFAKGEGNPSLAAKWISDNLLPTVDSYKATRERFLKQFVVLPDNWFTHFVRNATEVYARIGLNYNTKTVKDGALFYQEFLPTETLMYSVIIANAARRRDSKSSASDILSGLVAHLPPVVQIGGDETTGKGFCSTRLITGGN